MSLKHIVITGASNGLGAALARVYAGPGIVLGLIGRDQERLDAIAREVQTKGALTVTGSVDITNAPALEVWLNDFDATYPIDLVIANAGISGGPGVMNGEDPQQVKKIFDVNVYGVFNTIHPIIERMKKRRRGHVAIISSIAGFRGSSTAPAYSTSKAAVRYYGQALYALLRPQGISVSVICPGFIETNMTKANNFPMPFLMKADRAAEIIKNGLRKNKYMIVFPWQMAVAARLQNMLPNALINFIYRKIPAKA